MQLQLVTAAVKLFLKSPQPRAQQMIQLVLTYATQVHHPPQPFRLRRTCSVERPLHPCQTIQLQPSICGAYCNSSNALAADLLFQPHQTGGRCIHPHADILMHTSPLDRWVDSVY